MHQEFPPDWKAASLLAVEITSFPHCHSHPKYIQKHTRKNNHVTEMKKVLQV